MVGSLAVLRFRPEGNRGENRMAISFEYFLLRRRCSDNARRNLLVVIVLSSGSGRRLILEMQVEILGEIN